MEQPADRVRRRDAGGRAAIGILLIGLVLSTVAAVLVRRQVADEESLRFTEAAADIEDDIVAALQNAASVTFDMRAFFVDRPFPSREDYDRWLSEVGLVDRFPAIRAMNIARLVEPDEVSAWEAENGVEVFPPREDPDVHAVLEMLHPLEPNRGALGLDLLGRPGAAGAVRDAAVTGGVTASDVLVLVQDTDRAAGFVLYTAMYDGPSSSPEARAETLRGWASAAFRAQDLVDAIDLNTRLVGFELRDVETAEPDTDLRLAGGGTWLDDPLRAEVRPLSLFGQEWELEVRAAGPLVGFVERNAPWLTLIVGAFLSLGAAGYVLQVRRAELRAIAGEADAVARLENANDLLEASNQRLAERNAAVGLANAELAKANQALEEANAELAVANDELEDANARLGTTNDELNDLNRRLVAANEVKDDFLAVVSHEFRTPLTVIRGFATTVLDTHGDDLPPRVADAIERIDRNATRLNTLVDDLLIAARIERGVMAPSPEVVDLPHRCNEVVEELGWSEAELRMELDPVQAWADASHLRRVLENLLSNARKYGEPPVVVSCRKDGGRAVVEVRDHGRGIPSTLRDALFRPFTQGDTGPTRRAQGVGLGLAISRQLAELNMGSLELLEGDGGAHFVLRLPLPSAGAVDGVAVGVVAGRVADPSA